MQTGTELYRTVDAFINNIIPIELYSLQYQHLIEAILLTINTFSYPINKADTIFQELLVVLNKLASENILSKYFTSLK